MSTEINFGYNLFSKLYNEINLYSGKINNLIYEIIFCIHN